jgi:succinate dehydrogenase / fumarate reductase membrane anchor subunit
MRTRLGRVRGLGAARDGVAHWWAQRITAIALVPLLVWFVVSLVALAGAPHAAVIAWLKGPISAILMVSLLVAGLHHMQLGLQVVIEDYVHAEAVKIGLIIAVKLGAVLAGLVAVFSVLKIAFGAAA